MSTSNAGVSSALTGIPTSVVSMCRLRLFPDQYVCGSMADGG
jgi:hypothetical protein